MDMVSEIDTMAINTITLNTKCMPGGVTMGATAERTVCYAVGMTEATIVIVNYRVGDDITRMATSAVLCGRCRS